MMKRHVRNLFRLGSGPLACEDVEVVLQHHLDRHLDDDMAELVDAHLEDCRRCGPEADTYRRIKDALADRANPVPEDSIRRLQEFGRMLAGERGSGLLG